MNTSKIIKAKIRMGGATSWSTSTLAVENNKFYLGTFAATLNISDFNSKIFLEIPTIQKIESVVLYKDFVFAARDGFIGLYDKTSDEFLYGFVNAHISCIHSIITHENLLISGSDEIKRWDLETRHCLNSLKLDNEIFHL